jgi:hypothetical protein
MSYLSIYIYIYLVAIQFVKTSISTNFPSMLPVLDRKSHPNKVWLSRTKSGRARTMSTHRCYCGYLCCSPDSPPARAPCPPTASKPAPSSATELSRATTHRVKKQNVLVKGIKTLFSMCRSNDALIHLSHQQMSQRLSLLEERQREMHTCLGFETPEPVVYPPLPPPAVEDPWAWY